MYIHKYLIGELSLESKVKEQKPNGQALDQIALTLTQINEKLETLLIVNKQLLKINEALLQKRVR